MITVTGIDGADGLKALAADFELAVKHVPGDVRKETQDSALRIKTDWRRRWSGFKHAPRLPYAVTYETKVLGGLIDAEIGPDKDRPQGALGNLFEYGSVKNAPIPGGAPALEAERPRFEKAIESLAVKSLEAS